MTIGGFIGGVLGGVAGFFIGGPTGALIGFQIGMGIGSFIDPPREDEEELARQDITYNTFTRNAPVPVIYGTCKVAGNILWLGNTRSEVVERDVGGSGKGTPSPTVREVWYWADFAMGLSEGPISGVSKVLLDEEDITTHEGISYTTYLGTATQNVDSVISAAAGATAPVFRNTAYLRVGGRLGYANRIPNITAVVNGILGVADTCVTGQYTGTGVSGKAITGVGFRPAFVLIIGNIYTCWASASTPTGISYSFMAGRYTDGITALGLDGFTVGNNAVVNAVGVEYYYLAVETAGSWIAEGTYTGDGTASQTVASGWQPDVVFVVRDTDGAIDAYWNSAKGGDNSVIFNNASSEWSTGYVTGVDANGFSVGTSLNTAATVYRYLQFKARSGYFEVGSVLFPYVGNNADDRPILTLNAVGLIFIKGVSKTGAVLAQFPVARHKLITGDSALQLGSGYYADMIQEIYPTRETWFEVGTHLAVNYKAPALTGNDYPWFSFGLGLQVGLVVLDATPAISNPAWAVRDILLNTRYGLGLPAAKIDGASFQDTADYCDALVTNPDGTSEKRFILDYVLGSQNPILDHLRCMLATFRGFLVWSQGTVKLRVEKDETVSQAFTMSSIVADSFQWRKQSYRDRANVVRIDYIHASDDYRQDFAEAFDDWDIDATGERRERALQLLGITRSTQAQRMALFYLDQSIHIQHACSFRVGIGALKAEVGDIIQVSHDVPGWVAKSFRIAQIEEAENDELTLLCLEHNADIYHDRSTTVQEPVVAVVNPYEIPYHVIRLSAQKRPGESAIDLSFTRAHSADWFAGAMLYRKRGAQAYEGLLLPALALGPTAYLDGQVNSLTQTVVGSPVPGGFSDTFSRANAASLGAGWTEHVQTGVWDVQAYTARRGDPGSGGATGDAIVRVNSLDHSGDGEVIASLLDTSRLGSAAQIGVVARWQPSGGSAGQFYYGGLETKTQSDSILSVGIYRVTSGAVWTQLSLSTVASGAYFTTTTSPTTLTLRIQSYTLTAMLGSSAHVTAVDSWITGAGQGGLARRAGGTLTWVNRVMALRPTGFWRLGEASGVSTAADYTANAWHGVYTAASGGVTGLLGGDADTAAVFNGTSGYVDISSTFQVRSAITITALVKPAAAMGGVICSKRNTAPNSQYCWEFAVTQSGEAFLRVNANANQAFSATSLCVGSIYLIGGTYDVSSSLISIYVNGAVSATGSYATLISSANVSLVAGRRYHTASEFFFNGTIDELTIFDHALSSGEMMLLYYSSLGSLSAARGERWDNFMWGPLNSAATEINSPIPIRGLVDGWSARLFDTASALIAGGVASLGTVTVTLTTSAVNQPLYGFLQVFQDQTYTVPAPLGRLPLTSGYGEGGYGDPFYGGWVAIRGGDEYAFQRGHQEITNVQTTLPLFNARGGFSNIGSLRLRVERLGYATFTDSQFTGVTRGAGGTTAASHTNALSLGALVVTTGPVGSSSLLTLTGAATNPTSNMTLFPSNSGYDYYGASSKFSRLTFALAGNASAVLSLGYEYSTGDGAWASLATSGFIPPVDTTSGFTRSGHVWVEPPGDWSPTMRVASGGSALADSASRYYMRILRSNSVGTSPVEMQVLLDGDIVIAGRAASAYEYTPVLADSGAALTFKAISIGVRGQMADGTKAPVTGVWS